MSGSSSGDLPSATDRGGPDPTAGAAQGADQTGQVLLNRRRFLLEGVAFVAAGAIVGAGAILLATAGMGRPRRPTTTLPPGLAPTPAGATEEPIQSAPPPGPGRVARENERRGTNRWEIPLHGRGNAEGYASDVSVTAGDQFSLHLSSTLPQAGISLYRLGWYGGNGARLIARWPNVPIAPQPAPTTDPVTGLIRATWSPAVSASVPDGWVSGLYLAVIAPLGGSPQYTTFVVRESQPAAPILFVSSTTTHQAYNPWGGKSLYPDQSTGALTVSGGTNAVVVSWDRPYASHRGAGLVLRWEYPFVRWIESRGYDVGYAADLDLERHPEMLAGRRLIVFVGHPEYWSVAMRRNLEAAIEAGTNVAFFSANEIYWRVRYGDLAGRPYRTGTCYRTASLDPLATVDPAQATVKWRDEPSPDPESRVVGQMYGHMLLAPADFVCSAPDHWLYAGTGMSAGDRIANLIGQEYDRYWTAPGLAPAGTRVLAASPVRPNLGHLVGVYGPAPSGEPWPPQATATIYTAPSGATVFAAGTQQWSWGLDGWGSPDFEGVTTPVDPRVATMTSNILDRLGT